jgi:hypothetical protein
LIAAADDTKSSAPQQPENTSQSAFDQVVDRIANREHATLEELRKYSPVVETYIQNMRPDPELGSVPMKDTYFLGRLDMTAGLRQNRSYMKQPGFMESFTGKLTSMFSLNTCRWDSCRWW